MRQVVKLLLVAMLLGASASAVAQGLTKSDGEAFLEAVEEGDAAKAYPFLKDESSRVANYRGYKGEAALHIATRLRRADWVGSLLRIGASPDLGDSKGDTPLIIAARMGFEEAAGYMIRFGANVDTGNKRGETPLIAAVQARQPRLVELLLKAGANPDKADHAAGYSARDYAKRDTRNRDLLKLIETVKSTKRQAVGPSVN